MFMFDEEGRYPACGLIDFAMGYLKIRGDLRALARLKPDSEEWKALNGALSKVKIYQLKPKQRLRTVKRICPRAGNIEFEMEQRPIAVKVNIDIRFSHPRL